MSLVLNVLSLSLLYKPVYIAALCLFIEGIFNYTRQLFGVCSIVIMLLKNKLAVARKLEEG